VPGPSSSRNRPSFPPATGMSNLAIADKLSRLSLVE
jgi:hypothetical protein